MSETPDRAGCCGTCRFWELYSAEEGSGICHRYPPQLPSTRKQEQEAESRDDCRWVLWGLLPWTSDMDWCGEWQSD